MSHEVPQRPWEKVAVDLLTQDQKDYLVMVDYYSGFWELDRLHTTDSGTVVQKLKRHFARYGSPCQLVSDNGPQFVAAEFQKLTKEWGIKHMVTSSYNSKANGHIETAVKSSKKLLHKTAEGSNNFHFGLLAIRNIASQGIGSSPAQWLMNRRTRTLLPTTSTLLEPRSLSTNQEIEKLKDVQKREARYYNAHAKDLPPLHEGDTVRLKPFPLGQKEWKKGVVVERLDKRSYERETADGSTYRRNRIHLRKTNEPPPGETVSEPLGTPTYFRNARVANESPSGSTLTELQQVPSHSEKPGERKTYEKSLARDPPHSEPCEETQAAEVRTRSGTLVTRPSYLKDFVA